MPAVWSHARRVCYPACAMQDVLAAAVRAVEGGEVVALVTVVATEGSTPRKAGARMLVFGDGRLVGSVGGGRLEAELLERARAALASGRPELCAFELTAEATGPDGLVCGGTVRAFVEPLEPSPTLLLFGAGHVSAALARLARAVGFRIEVADDREEQLRAEHFPDADRRVAAPAAEAVSRMTLGSSSYAVVATRGIDSDTEALAAVVNKGLRFVGLLGSRKKAEKLFERLRERGVAAEEMARVRTPLGIPIGAQTSEEIAVSILAELIAVRRGAGLEPKAT
jgi:xanthine dehydrogenase accessory factor